MARWFNRLLAAAVVATHFALLATLRDPVPFLAPGRVTYYGSWLMFIALIVGPVVGGLMVWFGEDFPRLFGPLQTLFIRHHVAGDVERTVTSGAPGCVVQLTGWIVLALSLLALIVMLHAAACVEGQ